MSAGALRRWWFAAALFALVLGVLVTWAVATPLFASPDEAAHLYKAYGTAHGELLGDTIPGESTNIRQFDIPQEMGTPDLRCYVGYPDRPAACATGSAGATISTAAVYPPFWYVFVGGGARLTGHDTSQRVYRTAAAALCAALVTAAFCVARRSRARALSPLLLLGLTPMTLFLAGSVNPNGFEITAFLLLFTLCLHLDHPAVAGRRGGIVAGSLVAVVLLSRFASSVWVASGALVVAVLLGRAGVRRFLHRRFLVPALGLSGAAVVALFAWSAYSGVNADDNRVASDWGTGRVITYTVGELPEIAQQMVGVLGWLDTDLPVLSYVLVAAIAAVAVAGVVLSRDRRLGLATATVVVLLAVVPVLTNVLSAPTAGLIWQGRYSLPLFTAVGVLGMIGWRATLDRRGEAAATSIRLGVTGCFVVAEVAAFWQALRRFAVGADGKIWLTEPLPWKPAVAPMLLIGLNAVLVTATCAVVLAGTRPGQPTAQRSIEGTDGHAVDSSSSDRY